MCGERAGGGCGLSVSTAVIAEPENLTIYIEQDKADSDSDFYVGSLLLIF